MISSNRIPRRHAPRGYSLIEVLVAIGIISLAIAAASRLSMNMALQEEINTRKSVAVNYAENVSVLWQVGVDDPSSILIAPDGYTYSLATVETKPLPEGASAEGSVEKTTVTVTYPPSSDSADKTSVSYGVLRLPAGHR